MIDKAKQFLSNPLVGGIGSVASLLGLAAAVYLFIASQEERELRYYVHPAKTVVLRIGQASDLEVFHDGKKINSDLTAAQVIVWNSGEKSIRKDEILQSIILRVSDRKIIESELRSVSRDVCEFSTAIDSEGQLHLDWKILEHNDGASRF